MSGAELYRRQVTPDMAVVADAGGVVLEITDGQHGRVLRRVCLTNIDGFWGEVCAARAANLAFQEGADAGRWWPVPAGCEGGRLTRRQAVEWLIARGYARGHAIRVADALCRGGEESAFGMTYAEHNWRVPRECEDGRACVNSCASGPCSRRCTACLRLAWVPTAPCPACPDVVAAHDLHADGGSRS